MHDVLEDADGLLFEELRSIAALPGPFRQGTGPVGLTPHGVPARVAHRLTGTQPFSERHTNVFTYTTHPGLVERLHEAPLEPHPHCLMQKHTTSAIRRAGGASEVRLPLPKGGCDPFQRPRCERCMHHSSAPAQAPPNITARPPQPCPRTGWYCTVERASSHEGIFV